MALQLVRSIGMILNNFITTSSLVLLALSMLAFIILFAVFIYKDLGGIKFGRDSFLFFDYVFFSSERRANISALSVFCVFLFGLVFNYNYDAASQSILIDMAWILGVVLFFIHCRFFSKLKYEKKKMIFIRELMFNIKIQSRFTILWLARGLFVIVILNRFN